MIDLTKDNKDKDTFILRVYIDEESKSYIIAYASGRIEQRDFTIEGLNDTFLEMERQFIQYKDEFLKDNKKELRKVYASQIIGNIGALIGIYFSIYGTEIPAAIRFLLIMTLVVGVYEFNRQQNFIASFSKVRINTVLTAEKFLEQKEQFKIKVTNPDTGLENDWYLITLSDIDKFRTPMELTSMVNKLSEEDKQEKENETNKVLKKIYNYGDESSC